MPAPEEEIRQLVDRYYDAFNRVFNEKDLEPEMSIWSHKPDVCLLTAAGDREIGWEAVKAAFEDIVTKPFTGRMIPSDLKVSVVGDVAITTCIERSEFTAEGETRTGEHRATHIFRREDGEWKLMLRHADLDSEVAVIADLVAKPEKAA